MKFVQQSKKILTGLFTCEHNKMQIYVKIDTYFITDYYQVQLAWDDSFNYKINRFLADVMIQFEQRNVELKTQDIQKDY